MSPPYSYLEDLNPPQRDAVLHTEGPLLILAGAGSGKTRVLIYRAAHLINRGVDPRNILAVTFTNKAADEMKERVFRMLGQAAHLLWVATFHSTAAQILRRHIHLLGYSRDFTIYDEDDSLSAIKMVMKELDIDAKSFSPKWVRAGIEAAKRDRLDLGEIAAGSDQGALNLIARIAVAYQDKLKAANALDFNDLLLFNLRLFERQPDVLAHYQERFRYILVDEYQDTNEVQYLIVRNLARRYRNLCVVGDEDQSIYGWRGANLENILNFAKDFPGARVIKLEQNYRSTRNIIEAASAVISINKHRTPKKLWTENEPGRKIHVHEVRDERAEASWLVENVLRLKSQGYTLRDMAVFYRTHAQSRNFEDALRALNIPYAVYGGIRFYDRKEIKDIIAYLRVLINPVDEVSLLRIINEPARGIGPGTVARVRAFADQEKVSILEAISSSLKKGALPARARESVSGFFKLMRSLQRKAEKSEGSLAKLVESVIKKSGYEASLIEEATIEAQTRLENLDELLSAVSEYEAGTEEPSLQGFLEKVALYSDIDEYSAEEGYLVLMTLHSAKGLEFPVVFMVGMEEGLFPHIRSLEDDEIEDGRSSGLRSHFGGVGLEEERRLCYVGMTRARELLYFTLARSRSVRGSRLSNEPSRFLFDVPGEYLERPVRFSSWAGRESKESKTASRPDIDESYIESAGSEGYFAGSEEPEYWDPDAEVTLRKGMRVRHPDFGVGVIQKIEGYGEKLKLTIKFNKGTKKILAFYSGLEPAE
jgi:DNA helicase-2/ATP-dependent DNA helicase PcrA